MVTAHSTSPPPNLIVFGCGYVGSEVARQGLARGWRVSGLTRNQATARELTSCGAAVITANLAETSWHESAPGDFSYVVNCVGSGGGGLPGYWQSYVEGMKSIVQWAGKRSCGTFVYTSSTSVYRQEDGLVVSEDAPVGKGSEAAEPLLEAERLVEESVCFSRWFILRLAGIYGPGRHFLLNQLRAGAEHFPGSGANRLNLIHRDDAVSAVLACLDAPPHVGHQIYNVASDDAAPKAEVAAWLAARLNLREPTFGGLESRGPTRRMVRGRSGPTPDRLISNARIRKELGWQPRYRNFREGYEQIFAAEEL